MQTTKTKWTSFKLGVNVKYINPQKDDFLIQSGKQFAKLLIPLCLILATGYYWVYFHRSEEFIDALMLLSCLISLIVGGFAIYLYRHDYLIVLGSRGNSRIEKMNNPNIFVRFFAWINIVLVFAICLLIPVVILYSLTKVS